MRLASSLVAAGVAVGATLAAAPSAVAVPGSVTVCAKELGRKVPLSVEVGFMHGDVVEAKVYPLANNKCLTVAEAPAPSGAWVDASRQTKRIVVKTPSGKTHVKHTDRADFSLTSGDTVTVTLWFGAK
jgi:hypothetical protein